MRILSKAYKVNFERMGEVKKAKFSEQPAEAKISILVYCLLFLLVVVSVVTVKVLQLLPTLLQDEAVGPPIFVDVAQGRIVGQVKTVQNYTFYSFESIPFAKPPLKELRFKDPEPAGPWEGDLDATVLPIGCPQFLVWGKEDCLYLNIYTPKGSMNRSEPLPVMVFFYGGAFNAGGSEFYRGTTPLVKHDVIVINTNYRLGVLGFLSTEDEVAPGNLGLKDQTLALRWINDNIEAFGGDTKRITIFGESAGASSVHYQMLVPSAAGLFSGAIMQSGSSFTPWSRGRDFRKIAQEIGVKFNCPIESSEELISCLQEINQVHLGAMYWEFIEWNFQPFYFAPRVDGKYLPDDPVTLVKLGLYSHVPVMMGVNRNEGSLESAIMYWDRNIINSLVTNFTKYAEPSLELYDDEKPLETATKVYDHYLGGLNFEFEDADNVTRLYSDRLFTVPMDWLTQMTADVDEVYLWENLHKGRSSVLNLLLGLSRNLTDKWICHGDELFYLFNPGMFGTPTSPEDVTVGNLYTKMWTNFAKTGNPTPDDSLGYIWERSNADDLRYLAITANPPLSMETDKRAKDRAFWETLPLRINDLRRS